MNKFLLWSKKLKLNWVNLALLVFLLTAFCLLMTNLGRDALFDWDEGIYAQLGNELIRSGNWFTNSWNYSTWFEKPPGISWISALGQLVAGHSAYGARLALPAISTLTLYMIFLLGKKLKNNRVGLIAAGLVLSFNLFLGRTRALNADMPLILGIVTTLYLILTNQSAWKVALIVALSVWFKGLAGLLPLLISLPLFFTKGKKYLLSTIYYLLIFILPWHLYSYLKYGQEFLNPYFFEQVLSRETSPIEFHLESRWFYFQYLFENLGLGMIIVLTLALLTLAFSFLKKNHWKQEHILVWWLAVPLVIFTLAKTRLFWYILPVYPAIALIVANFLDSFAITSQAKKILTILSIGVLAQGLRSAYFSVEPHKLTAQVPNRIQVVSELAADHSSTLAVLVPPSERIAEAILPSSQRISSSFRYGGMPSVVYYYNSPVIFFYNVDDFIRYWEDHEDALAMVVSEDQALLPEHDIIVTTTDYLGITKGAQ